MWRSTNQHQATMIFQKSSQLVNFVLRGWKLRWWPKLHLNASSTSTPSAPSTSKPSSSVQHGHWPCYLNLLKLIKGPGPSKALEGLSSPLKALTSYMSGKHDGRHWTVLERGLQGFQKPSKSLPRPHIQEVYP